MTIWYTSDTHFSHENIVQYSGRPFANANEMDEILIKKWNEVVKPSDHIWHLGDLTMHRQISQIKHRVLDRLNGHKRLILGNHDLDKTANYLKFFEKLKSCHVHDKMLFTHIPIHPRSVGRFKAVIHGHTHNQCYEPVLRLKYDKVWEGKEQVEVGECPFINVCVEQTDYRPISLEEIRARL